MDKINKLVTQAMQGLSSTRTQSKQWPHLQQKKDALLTCYSDLKTFCLTFNPSLQRLVAEAEDRAILGTAPMLCVIDAAYGEGSAAQWLIPQLHDLCAAVGVKTKLDENQFLQLAKMIRNEFGDLKATEVMLFLWRLKGGHYGEFYGSVDIQRVMRALRRKFVEERAKVLDAYESELKEQARIERAKTALRPDEIVALRKRLQEEGKI